MKKWSKIAPKLLILLTLSAEAAYYDTLPSGVRMLVARQVKSESIVENYNSNKTAAPTTIDLNMGSEQLYGFLPEVDETFFNPLKEASEEEFQNATFGHYFVDGQAQINALGMGLAWGLSNKTTLIASIPYYKANVNMKVTQLQKDNIQEKSEYLENNGSGLVFQGGFPTNGSQLQSLLMNEFGYEPAGDWYGEGYGDLEITLKYKIKEWDKSGIAAAVGFSVPTGRENDPDILQDISFGSGYWQVFGEFGGGVTLGKDFNIDSYIRGSYGFSDDRIERLTTDPSFTLTSEKGNVTIHPGTKLEYSLSGTYTINDWLSITPEYIYKYKQADGYDAPYESTKLILERNTEQEEHKYKLAFEISSVNSFLNDEFLLPFMFILSTEQTIGGKNVPNVGLYNFELRLMF